MPIPIATLESASLRASLAKSATLEEVRLGVPSVFLCHSHKDSEAVRGLITLFSEHGWRVYVDWQDTKMPEEPDRDTARRIQKKIETLQYFIFLATENSVGSRWCPWEIGFADKAKSSDSILIVPTTDRTGKWHGNEYLQLYRKIDLNENNRLTVWHPGEMRGVALTNL